MMVLSADASANSVWGRGWKDEEAHNRSEVLTEEELTGRKGKRKVRVGGSVSRYLQVTRAVTASDPENSVCKGSIRQLDRVLVTGKSG